MSRLIRNKKLIGATSNDSSHIIYDPSDTSRSETTVKSELDRINSEFPIYYKDYTITFDNEGKYNASVLIDGYTPISAKVSAVAEVISYGLGTAGFLYVNGGSNLAGTDRSVRVLYIKTENLISIPD